MLVMLKSSKAILIIYIFWSQRWQLPFNVNKCKVMNISNKKTNTPTTYFLNAIRLEWVDTFKYLGVVIDCKLKWGDQINHSTFKATKILNLIRRNLAGCSKTAKNRAYLALVRPHLEFAVPVWSPHLKKDITALEKVQKRAARWICAKWDRATFKWNKSYEDCCNELNWVTLERRRDILTCCQVYKIVNNLDCIRFQCYFSFSNTITRSHSLSLVCNHSRINSFRYSFFIRSAFLWNSLPSDLVQSISYNSFKLKLKHYYLLH